MPIRARWKAEMLPVPTPDSSNTRLFYAWLFRQRRVNVEAQDRLVESFPISEALTQDVADRLGALLTNDEVERGCRGLNPGKAPGPDGMISELYRDCPWLWAPILRCSFNSGLARGEMSPVDGSSVRRCARRRTSDRQTDVAAAGWLDQGAWRPGWRQQHRRRRVAGRCKPHAHGDAAMDGHSTHVPGASADSTGDGPSACRSHTAAPA